MTWRAHLRADPLGWLLAADTPAVRAATLQRLLDLPADAAEVRAAGRGADPVDPGRPDQLGADPDHPQVARACDYALGWCPTAAGGFGCSAAKAERPPPPSAVIHCLNGNLLRALIGLGRLDDPRV